MIILSDRKLTALPSVVICKDGTERELDSLPENEKKEIRALLQKSISSAMSDYFSENSKEWDDFIDYVKKHRI